MNVIKLFEGTNFEIGLQQGRLYKKNNMTLCNIKFDSIIYNKLLKVYQEYFPNFLEECRGASEASNISYEKLTYFLMARELLWQKNRAKNHQACSIFGIANKDGCFIGRNYDMIPEAENFFQTYKTLSKGATPFIAISDMGISGMSRTDRSNSVYTINDAINKKGLFIGLTLAHSNKFTYGLYSGHIIRLIVESCANIEDAIKIFKNVPLSCPKNFFIADRFGDMVVVEHNSKKFKLVYPKNRILVKTNHYLNKEFAKQDIVIKDTSHKDTFLRYNEIMQKVGSYKDKLQMEDIIKILSDKQLHIYQNKPNLRTIWSLVIDTKNKKYNLYYNLSKKRKCVKLAF